MSVERTLRALRQEMERDLTGNVLPYWMRRAVDERHGGFVGLIGPDEVADPEAPRGSILNARILWTFSAAYRALGDEDYRRMADRAAEWIRAHVVDREHGGVHWMVSADGAPLDHRKHVYAQAFAVYAFAEHHLATGDEVSLDEAIALFGLIERHAADPVNGGYQEAFSRDWVPLDDVRLSAVDAPERRSMNTHLHLLEAYATLLRAWPDPLLRDRLCSLIKLFLVAIVDPATGHMVSFFDDDWTPRSWGVSYGHDIEASWLLLEAADVVGDDDLRDEVRAVSTRMAAAVLDQALDARHGGIFYEAAPDGTVETDKEWWPQAEAVVGFLSAWEETGRAAFLSAAAATWEFTRRHVVDHAHGEWHRRVSREGEIRRGHEKVGPWKCPYHNGRAALEVMRRVPAVEPAAVAPAA